MYTSYPTWPSQNTKMSVSFLNWIFSVHVKSNNKWNLGALIKLKVNYLIPILAGKVHLITTHHMVRSRTTGCTTHCYRGVLSRICYPAFWKLKGVFASTKSSRNNGPVLLFETIFALKLFPVVCCYGQQPVKLEWKMIALNPVAGKRRSGDSPWWRQFQM